jgi:hypothetical protein
MELAYFNFRPKLMLTKYQQLPLLLINAEKIVERKIVYDLRESVNVVFSGDRSGPYQD